ncbi:type VI secretion system amidase immunity protein Tai4 [Ralstonia solanacearum]|uniref:type VI secretion system amidase immunity protein Tai4 n=2 Tax=Ralstonia solanacearum TaxID=305 RepID=UPI002174EA22|nr:type VI secretion system amidase immunity protein Tai4 [Ralstonia solanacearum]
MMSARLCLFAVLCSSLAAFAADSITAIRRTNAENYKDRALAACLSAAYRGSEAGADSDATKSVFLEWTYYDEDQGNRAIDLLAEKYLRRDYGNPTEGYAGAQFKLLKCLDMYHSQELDAQVRKFVPHPNWVGDKPRRQK